MQIDRREYDVERHDMYKALSVKQPLADMLTVAVFRDENGSYHAEREVEFRSRNTNYRGDVLICSSSKPEIPGRLSGVTCGFVELYDTKPIEALTPDEWKQFGIPEEERPRKGFVWYFRNPRRVVEMPIRGQLGVYNLIVPKGDITEYPREMALGQEGWNMLTR